MTEIQFLASSKPFSLPREMEVDDGFFLERGVGFFYKAAGLGNKNFWTYLEHFMEVGEVIELYHIPVQNWYHNSIRR